MPGDRGSFESGSAEVRRDSAFVESLGPAPERRRKSSAKGLRDALASLSELLAPGGRPEAFKAKHLVALYARLHAEVYGVEPAELSEGATFHAAVSAADRLAREAFDGRAAGAIEFLRFVWRRERSREKRRRAEGSAGFRIGWRLQFVSRELLTDYRLELARAAETRNVSSHR